jgi:hypothetical protein
MAKIISVGAICSAPLKYVKPSRVVQDKHPSIRPGERLEGLIAQRREVRKLNRIDQPCIIFRHSSFENVELYCHERWCRVDQEGPGDQILGAVAEIETVEERSDEVVEIPADASAPIFNEEDAILFRNQGFDVDDDNEPAPENILVQGEALNDAQTWGWSGICHRKILPGTSKLPPELVGLSGPQVKSLGFLSLFFILFPVEYYLHEVLLVQLNKNLEENKERSVGLGEFLRFLGIWFYMATFDGYNRSAFWSLREIDDFEGAPKRFHKWMSKKRFETIHKYLEYTNRPTPTYADKFHGIRQLIEEWNSNMAAKFVPSWVSCLDESMSPWAT